MTAMMLRIANTPCSPPFFAANLSAAPETVKDPSRLLLQLLRQIIESQRFQLAEWTLVRVVDGTLRETAEDPRVDIVEDGEHLGDSYVRCCVNGLLSPF